MGVGEVEHFGLNFEFYTFGGFCVVTKFVITLGGTGCGKIFVVFFGGGEGGEGSA